MQASARQFASAQRPEYPRKVRSTVRAIARAIDDLREAIATGAPVTRATPGWPVMRAAMRAGPGT